MLNIMMVEKAMVASMLFPRVAKVKKVRKTIRGQETKKTKTTMISIIPRCLFDWS
jgi:hypothetical protein